MTDQTPDPNATISALQSVVASQKQQLDAIAQRESQAHLDAKINEAIDAAGVRIHPAARDQVIGLLRNEASVVTHDGKPFIVGPNLRPLTDHIKDRLNSESFRHFQIDGTPSMQRRPPSPLVDGFPSSVKAPISPTGGLRMMIDPFINQVPARPGDSTWSTSADPEGRTLGAEMTRRISEQAAAQRQSDPRLDMSRPLGLTRR